MSGDHTIDVVPLGAAGFAVGDLAALAARCQAHPRSHCAYLSEEAADIETEILEVDDWVNHTHVAVRAGELVGWLLAEVDPDMGRVWWWGPFVDGAWSTVAFALYDEARTALDDRYDEEEFATDTSHDDMRTLALGRGFDEGVASIALEAQLSQVRLVAGGRAAGDADSAPIGRLHGELFPASHMLPQVAGAVGADERVRTVVGADGHVVAYAIAEVQADGSGYIDFLGTDPAAQGRGHGRAAISAACAGLAERGCTYVHLTVRANNAPARALYKSLGFAELRDLTPYRKGFNIG